MGGFLKYAGGCARRGKVDRTSRSAASSREVQMGSSSKVWEKECGRPREEASARVKKDGAECVQPVPQQITSVRISTPDSSRMAIGVRRGCRRGERSHLRRLWPRNSGAK